MKQALLERLDGLRRITQVVWLDDDLAVVGKNLRDEAGLIWKVDQAYRGEINLPLQRRAQQRWEECLK